MAIIFIPGIKGTELIDAYALDHPGAWPREGALPGDMIADPRRFSLAPGDAGAAHRLEAGRVVARLCAPLIHTLRATLAPRPVHAFGYDWRQRLEDSARRLCLFMDEIVEHERRAGRPGTLGFVTHSMGGLLLRSALTLRQRTDPFEGIDRVVFIAPPFRGALGSTFALVAGETDEWLGIGPAYRKIARSFPAVYQMTPSWPGAAHNEDGTALDLFDAATWQAGVARGTSFRADLLRDAEAFVRGPAARHGGHSAAPMLDDAALAGAADKVLVVCGSGEPTPTALPVLTRNAPHPNWFDFEHMRMDPLGDGRVALRSAAVPGVPLAAFRDTGLHAVTCRDDRVIALTSSWLAGRGAPRLAPRTPDEPVSRDMGHFSAWNGTLDSLADHVA